MKSKRRFLRSGELAHAAFPPNDRGLLWRRTDLWSQESASWNPTSLLVPAGLLWLLLWLNLNSGPWNLHERGWPWGYVSAVRAALPFVVAPLVFMCRPLITQGPPRPKAPSTLYLKVYSCIALVGGVYSPEPFVAFYFGLAHILTILVWELVLVSGQKPGSVHLWFAANLVIATAYAIAIIYVGRELIFGASDSAYAIISKIDEVAGMPMSRSSGVARFAAIPAVASLALFFCQYGWKRYAWLGTYCAFSFVIYRMQSRGALFASVAASVFVIVAASRRRWTVTILLAAGALLLFKSNLWGHITQYLMRGQDADEFRSFTGRTDAWRDALHAFWNSPLIGSGNFADRLLIETHVHNAFLQALLLGGALGFIPFALSWLLSWKNLLSVWSAQEFLSARERTNLLIAGGLLVFFTIRSFPETTTASFSVDLLVMVPVIAYLDLLPQTISSRNVGSAGGKGRHLVRKGDHLEALSEALRDAHQTAPPDGTAKPAFEPGTAQGGETL